MSRLNLYRLDDDLSVDHNNSLETVVLYDTRACTPKRETALSELQMWALVTWWLDEHDLAIDDALETREQAEDAHATYLDQMDAYTEEGDAAV